jgi:transcriptional regulator with XRE-family HTH domain
MTTKKSYFEKLEKKHGQLTFGETLKAFREAEGLAQNEFAKKIGLSTQNLNDLEKGRRIPSPTRAAGIAKKLEVPAIGFIKLCLRDSLHSEGFYFDVILK